MLEFLVGAAMADWNLLRPACESPSQCVCEVSCAHDPFGACSEAVQPVTGGHAAQ